MKIDLNSIDTENFLIKKDFIAGEECTLVIPNHIGCKWTKDNLHFRSSIWNSQGELISAGKKKFFNQNEQPDIHPFKFDETVKCLSEIDGSLLCLSNYKGQKIIRTRGVFDARSHETGAEIDFLEKKYPKAFNFTSEEFTLLFEWVGKQKIVINYGDEPNMILIGKVYHQEYTYETQSNLDLLSLELEVPRPRTFRFGCIEHILEVVEKMDDQEGFCVYHGENDQFIRKVKSSWYLKLHRLKSELSSVEKILDVYLQQEEPNYEEFYGFIKKTFDFELAEQVKESIKKLTDAKIIVHERLKYFEKFLDNLRESVIVGDAKEKKKQYAMEILSYFRASGETGYLFNLLNRGKLEKKEIKELYLKNL